MVCALDGAHEGLGALVDQELEVDIVDGGQGQVEQVSGEGRYRGEVAVEEDGVQNGCCCEGSARKVLEGNRHQRGRDAPLTTSLTHERSAKMSRWYSGRRRVSMVAWALFGRFVVGGW